MIEIRNAIQNSIDFMEDSTDQELTLENITKAINYSQWHFARLFTSFAGMSPIKYFRRRRLSKAALFYASGSTLYDSAAVLGYKSAQIMARAFKNEFDCSIGEWVNAEGGIELQIRLQISEIKFDWGKIKMKNAGWMNGVHGDAYAHSYPEALYSVLAGQDEEISFTDVMGFGGFAFYIFTHNRLCPSAMSMFDFNKLLGFAIENNGFKYDRYTRFWHEVEIKDERRIEAADAMKRGLSKGLYPICWDAVIPEWSMIVAYDADEKAFASVGPGPFKGALREEVLGERDIAIMDVSIVGDKSDESTDSRFKKAIVRAVDHSENSEVFGDDYTNGLKAWDMWADYLVTISEEDIKDLHSERYYINNVVAARKSAALFVQKYAGENENLIKAAGHYRAISGLLYPVLLEYDCGTITGEQKLVFADKIRSTGAEDKKAIVCLKAWLAE